MTDREYRADKRIAQSDLINIKKSPAYYKYCKENGHGEQTQAMMLGSAIHKYILEKDTFFDEYHTCKKMRRAGKEWDAIIQQAGNRQILFDDDFDKIVSIHNNILNHRIASSLLYKEKCVTEEIVFWENNGLELKSKIDALRLTEKSNIIIDLKTTLDVGYLPFQHKFYDYNYHIQAAFYTDAAEQKFNRKIDSYVIIAVEKEPPFLVNVFELDDEVIEFGRKEYTFLLSILKGCLESNFFPAYDVPNKIYLPEYVKTKMEQSNQNLANAIKRLQYKQETKS